jgi:hypothetical protein
MPESDSDGASVTGTELVGGNEVGLEGMIVVDSVAIAAGATGAGAPATGVFFFFGLTMRFGFFALGGADLAATSSPCSRGRRGSTVSSSGFGRARACRSATAEKKEKVRSRLSSLQLRLLTETSPQESLERLRDVLVKVFAKVFKIVPSRSDTERNAIDVVS